MKKNMWLRWCLVKRIFSLFLIVLLVGCSSDTGIYSYDDFEVLFEWEALDSLDNEHYLIYYYDRDFFGTDCAGCQIVSEPLFEYGKENDESITLLLINERTVTGVKPFIFRDQPMIALIENNEIVYTAFSAAKILETLDIMNEDNFEINDLIEGEPS